MDIWAPSKRSAAMSRIKGRGSEATEQELTALCAFISEHGEPDLIQH